MKFALSAALAALCLLAPGVTSAQTPAGPLPMPRLQFFDSSGRPLGGGKVYTYSAGTSTPLVTYTDAGGTVANANPVVLDAGGFGSIWVKTGVYKIAVQNSAGVQQWTADNVSNAGQIVMAAAGGAGYAVLDANGWIPQANLNYNQGGTGAVNRALRDKLGESVSVKDFGATCDGSGTGDQAAFAAANVYLTSIGGGTLLLPVGQCLPTSSLTFTVPVQLRGAGQGNTCALSPTCVTFPAGVSGFIFPVSAYKSGMRDFWLQSLSSTSGTDDGVLLRAQWFDMQNATISGFGRYGVYGDSTSGNNTDHLRIAHSYLFSNKSHGFYCVGSDCNAHHLSNIASYGNGGYGFFYASGGANVLETLVTNANTSGGFSIAGLGNMIIAPYCEGGVGNSFALSATHTHLISPYFGGCAITNSGGASNVVYSAIGASTVEGSTAVNITPQPGTTNTPTTYGFRSGVSNFGALDLIDYTDSASILHYSPGSTTLTIDASTLGITGAANVTGALTAGSLTGAKIPSIKSTTGTRYVCVDTSGNLVSSAAACSGT